jgi:hypothetical protein
MNYLSSSPALAASYIRSTLSLLRCQPLNGNQCMSQFCTS